MKLKISLSRSKNKTIRHFLDQLLTLAQLQAFHPANTKDFAEGQDQSGQSVSGGRRVLVEKNAQDRRRRIWQEAGNLRFGSFSEPKGCPAAQGISIRFRRR